MFIPRIYYPQPLATNETITLASEASHYLTKVLRLKDKDKIIFFNGEGGEYIGEIKLQGKSVFASIDEFIPIEKESPIHIELGQGISRSERMDYSIQKTTELGVSHIVPLQSMRSIVKLDEQKKYKRQQHWQRVAISACEQSGRTNVPEISLPRPLKNWASTDFDGCSIFFDPDSSASLNTIEKHARFRIAVGPESGWATEETEFLRKQNFKAVSLGPRILRTETAGVVALSLIQQLFGDL
jgi:16S rRNA (uracil1498-N3)-methyltransferase